MRYFILVITRNLLKLFFVFPINDNRVVFTSYSGKQFSCNPKYIYENLKKNYKFEYIWAFSDPIRYANCTDAKIVKYKSLKYIYYVLTARIIVENFESWSILPTRKGQIVINTWHGGGAYKKVGTDRKDARSFNDRLVKYKNQRISLYLSSSQKFTEMTIRDSFMYEGDIANIGMPRNDLLINYNSNLVEKIKYDLNLANKKTVLIAPTFRSQSKHDLAALDYERLVSKLSEKFSGEWVVLYRSHYYSELFNTNDNSLVTDVSAYPDMQELLLIANILITDYSSCMWDFSLKKGPVFLYATDLEDYNINEREFYTPISSWPFPFASSFEQLLINIEEFENSKYEQKVIQHHNDLGSFETGRATDLTSQIILEKLHYGEVV